MTSTVEKAPDLGAAPQAAMAPVRRERRSLGSYLFMPVFLALVCVGLYLYMSNQELDTIEERSLNASNIIDATWEHIQLAAVSTVFVVLIAIPLGVLMTRPFTRSFRGVLLTLANIGQAVPTIGILALLALGVLSFLNVDIGFTAAIVGLVAYAVLPVLRNTIVGLGQVDENILEAGRGMGISKFGVLTRIELPLAVPIILAGVRTALVINVGTATLAAYINAGGLGRIIVAGLSTNRINIQLTGAILTAVLALLIDYLAGIAEDVLRPKGL
ncbi:MAG: ABC transporter permease [Actinomycetota bacterium]|nr:ABC transporter permease [Actinomycetota bacterium]